MFRGVPRLWDDTSAVWLYDDQKDEMVIALKAEDLESCLDEEGPDGIRILSRKSDNLPVAIRIPHWRQFCWQAMLRVGENVAETIDRFADFLTVQADVAQLLSRRHSSKSSTSL